MIRSFLKISALSFSLLVHPVDWLDDLPGQVGLHGCVRPNPNVTAWDCPDQHQTSTAPSQPPVAPSERREKHSWRHDGRRGRAHDADGMSHATAMAELRFRVARDIGSIMNDGL